jgi:cytoskeletal protein RodZ
MNELKSSKHRTLGERLKFFRKRKSISLEKAEEETKIKLKYLVALEKGNFVELPDDVYTIGFLSKYADFLGAPKEELTELYYRERGKKSLGKIDFKSQIKEKRVYLTPKIIVLIGVILLLAGIFGYIFYSINHFTSAPNLEISSPVAESIINQDSVEIIGKTDIGATLTINDQVVLIDENGNFKTTAKLQPGINNIEITVTNRLKKENTKTIKILAEF